MKHQQKVENEISSKTTVSKYPEDTSAVLRTPEKVEPCCYDQSLVADVEKVDQGNVLKMLRYVCFNLDNPLPILKTQLNGLNLDLTIFTKHSLLFMHLQHQIYDLLKHSKYCKYAPLIMLMNRHDFVWQMEIMWDILENTEHS